MAVVLGGWFVLPTSASAVTSPSLAPSPAVASASAGIGVVSVVPATGNDRDPLILVTSALCPSGGTNVIGTILGPGLTAIGINVVPNSTAAIFPRTAGGGLYLPSQDTLRNLVNELPDPPVLKGTYQLRVECRGPSKIADLGDFYGSLVFDGHHGYRANEPKVPAGSLATIAPTEMPIPTAPPASNAPSPAAVKARAAAATSSGSSSSATAPWLVGLGVVAVLAGLVIFVRGRPTKKPTGGSR